MDVFWHLVKICVNSSLFTSVLGEPAQKLQGIILWASLTVPEYSVLHPFSAGKIKNIHAQKNANSHTESLLLSWLCVQNEVPPAKCIKGTIPWKPEMQTVLKSQPILNGL